MDELLGQPIGQSRELISFVKDRPGHDRRYAIDSSKLQHTLGWKPRIEAEEGFRLTAQWYLENPDWLHNVRSGAYQEYYRQQYQQE
jgi:dTDP-glucose 4,6-dehydratase